MKQKILFLLLIAMSAITAFTASADQLTSGGRTRTYYPYIPANLGQNRPLLISMHGMNQDANYQKGMLQIESIADTAKFAVVFPEGIDRGWDISGDRDINFVLDIIDAMVNKYGIDRNRVYLSGFSMGGMFTYHAINKIADKIAAFAPISGYPMGGQPFTALRSVPIIHTHGTGDDVVTFDGVQRSLDGWVEFNNCAKKAFVTNNYRNYSGATRHQWGPGNDGAEVVLIELANKGHWISNEGFYTGEEIWNFCKRYSLADKKPTVSISYPLADTNVTVLGTNTGLNSLHIKGNATTRTSKISHVNFYGDGKLIATVNEKPFECDWTDIGKGDHQILVEAVDEDGVRCGRAIPVSVSYIKKSIILSGKFAENTVPKGWATYDGKNRHTGEEKNLVSGSRVIKLTGDTRDFNLGMYIVNTTGKAKKGYAVYAETRTGQLLNLVEGTYELSFTACNWNMPLFGKICCEVIDPDTKEVLGSTEFMPAANIGGAASNSFSGSTNAKVTFCIEEPRMINVYFYADDAVNSDAVVADIKLVRTAATGIDDIEAAGKTPASVEYYDITGRRVAEPKGMVIRRVQFTDGTSHVDKIIK